MLRRRLPVLGEVASNCLKPLTKSRGTSALCCAWPGLRLELSALGELAGLALGDDFCNLGEEAGEDLGECLGESPGKRGDCLGEASGLLGLI